MEVTSRGDFVLYALLQAPLVLALALLAWKLGPLGLKLLSAVATNALYAGLAALYAWQSVRYLAHQRIGAARRGRPGNSSLQIPSGGGVEHCLFRHLWLRAGGGLGAAAAVQGHIRPVARARRLGRREFRLDDFFARPTGGWLCDRSAAAWRAAGLHGRNGGGLFRHEFDGPGHGARLRGGGDLLLLAVRQRRQWRRLSPCCR